MECAVCDGNTKLLREKTVLNYRKEEYPIIGHFYQCEKCGFEFTTDEIDGLDLNQVHNQYREKHKIPFPEQLRKIREKYGFSAKKMSEILGFGPNQYSLYEKGEVPNLSNGRLLNTILDTGNFVELFKSVDLSVNAKKIEKLESMARTEADWTLIKIYDLSSFDMSTPTSKTGYVMSNINKIMQVITYFANEIKPMKTKLNKLLFYADFLNYKNHGFGITGIDYRAIQMGPVPASYDMYYSALQYNEIISLNYDTKGIGELFIPNIEFNPSVLEPYELESLEYVKRKFKSVNTDKLIALSHKENGWKENEKKKRIIDYQQYAFDLQI